ncbi:Secreted [Seminavis robusta]|uniref:Secreted n=1 Tax=Seminavis robusta TaxID=568900 RepID=A0A9N8EYJ9_9STRA|nr:Secreted [Seminavis robusta]|eukprot:Sro1942_g306790.1 Secreted (650) ;mRNA; f:13775-16179
MKFQVGLILLTSLAAVGSAKEFFNREIYKDKTGLLGRRIHHTYEAPEDRDEDRRRGLKGGSRKLSGEGTVPPLEEVDDDAFVEYEPQTFYTAETLDFFRKGIDPEIFEWVNPDEIQAGETTCGFLKPELGSLFDVYYPTIEVYICMRFADVQPAAKGNLFLHCGGPSSLSDCVDSTASDLGPNNLRDYNFLSIDQRGMGRSWPNFAHEECVEGDVVRADNGTILYVASPPEYENSTFDNNDADDIILRLQPTKRRAESCWTCETCDFFLNATQEDGNVTNFHFLEYSGTRQLAEDIYRMRMVLNAPAMHVYGISYGTTVFSIYATIFPSYTGLFVLDSCAPPNPNAFYQASSFAIGTNDRIDYLVYSCSARNAREPGSCPVDDMRGCLGALAAGFSEIFGADIGPGFVGRFAIQTFLRIMYSNFDRAGELCELATAGDYDGVRDLSAELAESSGVDPLLFGAVPVAATKNEFDQSSKPTSDDWYVYGNEDYVPLDGGSIGLVMVNAQDQSAPVYDEQRFAVETIEINQKYTGAGTGNAFFGTYSTNFYWPKVNPLPPAGNSYLSGIILGILYDPNTPYVWTQDMRLGFKFTSLLTSQSIFHGIYNDPTCLRHLVNYFEDGFVNFVDGQVCGADFASEDDFLDAFLIRRH